VERIPSQHAKLRISTYIITSKSTRCMGITFHQST
jgi:hypothetical protein